PSGWRAGRLVLFTGRGRRAGCLGSTSLLSFAVFQSGDEFGAKGKDHWILIEASEFAGGVSCRVGHRRVVATIRAGNFAVFSDGALLPLHVAWRRALSGANFSSALV